MTRKERALKEKQYRRRIKLNIRLKRSHSDYIERLIKEHPEDRGIILQAERSVFNELRG